MNKWVGAAWLVVLCTACGPHKPTPPSSHFVTWSQQESSPRRLCVLPFTNESGQPDVGGQVRRSFAGHLSIKRFRDVELHEIDSRLPSDWRQLPAQSLGEILGCHALVYGIVTQADRLYLGLYADIALDGGILLIDTQTGQTLVEESYATRFRHGEVPLSLLGIAPSAVLMLRHLTNEQMLRAIDDLGRNLAALVPDLPPPVSGLDPAEMADTPSAASDGAVVYQLQVAAFRSSERAAQAVRLLWDEGYQAEVVDLPGADTHWYRVVLGPFPSAARAEQVAAAIGRTLPFSPIVRISPPS